MTKICAGRANVLTILGPIIGLSRHSIIIIISSSSSSSRTKYANYNFMHTRTRAHTHTHTRPNQERHYIKFVAL